MAGKAESDHVLEVFPQISQIGDRQLRDHVADIWCEVFGEMAWEDIHHVPKNNSTEKHRTLVEHIGCVTEMAMAMAEIAERRQGARIDRDALLVGCLLHDASKPVETEPDPASSVDASARGPRPSRTSALGAQVQHAVYVAHKMLARKMPLDLVNLVITHTHQSNIRGTSVEAAILFYADFADSDVGLSRVGAKTFAERWRLT